MTNIKQDVAFLKHSRLVAEKINEVMIMTGCSTATDTYNIKEIAVDISMNNTAYLVELLSSIVSYNQDDACVCKAEACLEELAALKYNYK